MKKSQVSQTIAVALTLLIAIAVPLSTSIQTDDTRVIRGIFISEFEGLSFVEVESVADLSTKAWGDVGWLVVEGTKLDAMIDDSYDAECRNYTTTAFRLEFRGKRVFGETGHGGLWSSEYQIEELIEIEGIDLKKCENPARSLMYDAFSISDLGRTGANSTNDFAAL